MENTLKNKALFFALYWGQKIVIWNQNLLIKPKLNILLNEIDETDVLELKSLLSISNEDAIELSNIEGLSDTEEPLARGRALARMIEESMDCSHFMRNFQNALNAIDFLRSKGYALPYFNLSVKTLVEYGWIKLI